VWGEIKSARGVNAPTSKPTLGNLKKQDGNVDSKNCPRIPPGETKALLNW